MPWSNYTQTPQLLSPCTATTEANPPQAHRDILFPRTALGPQPPSPLGTPTVGYSPQRPRESDTTEAT